MYILEFQSQVSCSKILMASDARITRVILQKGYKTVQRFGQECSWFHGQQSALGPMTVSEYDWTCLSKRFFKKGLENKARGVSFNILFLPPLTNTKMRSINLLSSAPALVPFPYGYLFTLCWTDKILMHFLLKSKWFKFLLVALRFLIQCQTFFWPSQILT